MEEGGRGDGDALRGIGETSMARDRLEDPYRRQWGKRKCLMHQMALCMVTDIRLEVDAVHNHFQGPSIRRIDEEDDGYDNHSST